MKQILLAAVLMLSALAANAQAGLKKVYDETIDPLEQIDKAVAEAQKGDSARFVICQVGGNWCPWCLRFADFVSKDADITKVIEANFVYIHVNYNPRKSDPQAEKLMRRLGNPRRFGFPVFVILDANGRVLHIQDSSFLEEGQGYNKDKVLRFLNDWTPKAVGNKGCGSAGCSKCQLNNEVVSTIMARRSVRKYLDRPVEHAKLELLTRCGINAPNGMNSQKWAVRVVENKDFIDATTAIFRKANPDMVARDANFKNMYRNAPNLICVATPDGKATLDAGMLGENIMLAAQSLGLGTCCLGGPVRFLNTNAECKPYLDKLNLPEGYKISFIIAVGYPDEQPEAKPRDESKVEFIK